MGTPHGNGCEMVSESQLLARNIGRCFARFAYENPTTTNKLRPIFAGKVSL
jgi:hypothetical protein